jgi:o-succinylbenzoate---CoA ligase
MENQMLPNWLKKRAGLTPERVALRFQGHVYTFQELYELSVDTAGRLTACGLKKGQFAGVLLKNHQDTVFVLLALQMLGITAVILNNRLTAEELVWQLEDSAASCLLTEEAFAPKLEEIANRTKDLPLITKQKLFQEKGILPPVLEEYSLAGICTVMYTSGTTGHPKGVIQTYGNHWWSAVGSALNLGLMEKDSWLCAVPMFHISGYSILVRSLVYGMSVVLYESFDEREIIRDIERYHVTIMSVVSVMLMRITAELKDTTLPSTFRCMLLGGGPAPLPLLEKCAALGIPVYQSYGMTETASQTVTLSPEYAFSKLGSAGKPLFPAQMKIVNAQGKEAARTEEGEIFVKGPNITQGYLNREQATRDAFKEGWLATGDMGYLDEEGFLYVLDRRSDLIISGGENIYPAEIEGVLLSHPDVCDAGAAGLPHDEWGHVPVAVIVKKEGAHVTEKGLIDFCAAKLAKYKVPKQVVFVEELPRNAAQKLLRRKLPEFFR